MTGDYPATASGSGGGTGEMTERAGHRAPGYVLIGLCAIAIAGWVLTGTPAIDDAATIGKIAGGACLILGVALIATGARKATPRR